MLKKSISVLVLVMMAFAVSYAQDVKFNGYASYVFNDRFDSRFDPNYYYKGMINDGCRWGGGIEYMIGEDYGIELSSLNMKSNVPLTFYSYNRIPENINYTAGQHYILAGSNRYFDVNNDKIELYTGAQAGILLINYKNPSNGIKGNITKFAWGVKAGSNFWLTDNFGIKLQAQLLSALQSLGADIYIGSGGTGAGISGNSSILQFGLGGGLCFKLAAEKKKK